MPRVPDLLRNSRRGINLFYVLQENFKNFSTAVVRTVWKRPAKLQVIKGKYLSFENIWPQFSIFAFFCSVDPFSKYYRNFSGPCVGAGFRWPSSVVQRYLVSLYF